MILSRVSIQRPVLATMMNLVLVLFGLIGLSRLPVRALPDIDPIIAKQDSDAQPIIWNALNSDRYSPLDLTTLAERQIKPRLQSVPGVSSVIIGGEKRFAMRLWLDSEKMAARHIAVLDVERALR